MKKFIIPVALLLIGVTALQLWVTKDRTGQKNELEAIESPQESAVGGSFTLTDQDGNPRSDADFRGRVMLVSFGYTHCPDICPMTVSTLSKTLALLGDKSDRATAIFITVDPARDTSAALKDFLKNFNPPVIGLTGSEQQIKQVADAYKVYYARAETGGDAFDHSGYIYLMSPQGRFMRVFPYNAPESEIAHAVEAALRS